MMMAGAASIDLTPPLGTHLAGDGAGLHRPARRILEPLYARALIVEAGRRRVCVLALELLCVTVEYTRIIRDAAARRFGLEPDAVMVHALQNHSAPSLGAMMLDPDFPFDAPADKEYIGGAESAYCQVAVGRAIEAIGLALDAMRPVQLGQGRGVCEGLAFNRRGICTDGSICMPWFYSRDQMPLGPTHIRYLEGPFDPEIGVLALRDESMRPVALLTNFACHPVNVFATDRLAISGDWPGAWAAALQGAYQGCVPVVLNGCCGNLNPWPPFAPDFQPDHRRMGKSLSDMARAIVERLSFEPSGIVDWRTRRLDLPYREVPDARLAEVRRILGDFPRMKWDEERDQVDVRWFLAASTDSIARCRARWTSFPYEIQVFRIGGTAIVALPGEPFVEGQLEFKINSPAALVQVAHMCSQYVGYLPTREAAARGGHEASELYTYWAKLAPRSLGEVVENVREMIEELFS